MFYFKIGLVSLYFLLASTILLGQREPQFEIQIGHRNPVRAYDISESGKYLVSSDEFGNIKVWDTKSGRVMNSLSSLGETVKDIRFVPGKTTFVIQHANRIRIKNITGKTYSTINFSKSKIKSIDINNSGQILYNTSKYIYIRDYNSDTVLKKIHCKSCREINFLDDSTIIYVRNDSIFKQNWNNEKSTIWKILNDWNGGLSYPDISLSRNKQRILVRKETGYAIFDKTGSLKFEQQSKPNEEITASLLDENTVCFISILDDSYRQIVFDYRTNDTLLNQMQNQLDSSSVKWLGRPQMHETFPKRIFYKNGTDVRQYDFPSQSEVISYSSHTGVHSIGRLAYSQRWNNLYFYQQSISEFSLDEILEKRSYGGRYFDVLSTSTDDYLVTLWYAAQAALTIANAGPDGEEQTLRIDGSDQLESSLNKFYYFPETDIILASTIEGKLYILQLNENSRAYSLVPLLLNLKPNEHVIDVSFNAEKLLVERVDSSHNKSLFCYTSADKKIELLDNYKHAVFCRQSEDIILSGKNESLQRVRIEEGQVKLMWEYNYSGSLNFSITALSESFGKLAAGTRDGRIYCFNAVTGELIVKGTFAHEDEVSQLLFLNDRRLLSSGLDGKICIGEVGVNYEKIVTILPIYQNKMLGGFMGKITRGWLLYTPDNYYFAKNVPSDSYHFVQNNNVYAFNQFDLKYNRPDIILERLNGPSRTSQLYYNAYKKRLEKTGLNGDDIEMTGTHPEVRITAKSNIPTKTNERIQRIWFEAKDSIALKSLNCWVNGVPVFGTKGLGLVEEDKHHSQGYVEIELSPGLNTIQLSATNIIGYESLMETVEITHESQASKPNLYFFGIGVAEYKVKENNLAYAVKDVRDVVAALELKKSNYNKIFIDTAFNESGTKEFAKAWQKKLLKTSVNDIVIVYFSGHGMLDSMFNYYLATYDIDFESPGEKGILFEDLESMYDSIPSRKKIMFIDACHSGEIDTDNINRVEGNKVVVYNSKNLFGDAFKERDNAGSFDLMKELFTDVRKNSGAHVIASSSGRYSSFEDDNYKNGVFTYALLEGIGGKADLNNDKHVTIMELKEYLVFRVDELTNGEQVPTSRLENALNDFKLW